MRGFLSRGLSVLLTVRPPLFWKLKEGQGLSHLGPGLLSKRCALQWDTIPMSNGGVAPCCLGRGSEGSRGLVSGHTGKRRLTWNWRGALMLHHTLATMRPSALIWLFYWTNLPAFSQPHRAQHKLLHAQGLLRPVGKLWGGTRLLLQPAREFGYTLLL